MWKSKTVLITGASSGIGAEFARQLAAKGANLILIARRTGHLLTLADEVGKQYGVRAEVLSMDLGQLGAAEDLHAETQVRGLHIDVLINNAGFGLAGEFLDLDAVREEEMLLLNMVSLTQLTRFYAQDMREQGGGHILLVASVAAFQATPTLSTYAASKAYVQSFGEAIAYELRPHNVNVTVLSPGGVATEFSEVAGQQLRSMHRRALMSATDVVKLAITGMEKGVAVVIPGRVNRAGVFANRLMPRRLVPPMVNLLIKSTLTKH